MDAVPTRQGDRLRTGDAREVRRLLGLVPARLGWVCERRFEEQLRRPLRGIDGVVSVVFTGCIGISTSRGCFAEDRPSASQSGLRPAQYLADLAVVKDAGADLQEVVCWQVRGGDIISRWDGGAYARGLVAEVEREAFPTFKAYHPRTEDAI